MIRRIVQEEEEVFDLELKAHGNVQRDLGRSAERERVLRLWRAEMKCPCEEPMQHLASRIKGKNK